MSRANENEDQCVYCGNTYPCNEMYETTGGGGMCEDCKNKGNK